ncbi:MAG TPA: hypothetical protein VE999_12045 [Gemmataceae bacterium]|nr:hypothetical protein [Reyranella sp.]HZV05805.1 hypothetical protein [Gemmataceae bacterium]
MKASAMSPRALCASFDKRPAFLDLCALGLVLAIMVAANREWIFNGFRWVDTWMYVGFFQHYDFPAMLAENKKIARLPWIILGYIVNRTTSPMAAQYILHLGMLAAGGAALYFVVLRQFGRAIAVIVTAFYLTYLPGHASGGWDYNNTPSGFVYLLTYWSLLDLTERTERPVWSAVWSGLAGTTLIHTNLLYVLIVPALVWFVAIRVRERLSGPALKRWTRQVLSAGFASGFSLTLVLALINVIVGRDFLFFGRLIARSGLLMMEPGREKVWWRPWSQSWWYDSHDLPLNGYHMPLLLIVLVMVAATAFFGYVFKVAIPKIHKQVIGIFLVSLAVYAVMQSTGHPLLQPYYMAFPLLIPTLLAMAAVLVVLFEPDGQGARIAWGGTASIATCTLFAGLFIILSADPGSWHFGTFRSYDGLFGMLPILGAFLVLWPIRHFAPKRMIAPAIAFVVGAMAATNAEWPSDPAYREAYSFKEQCRMRQPTFSLIMEADRFLFSRVQAGNYVPLVYRSSETLQIDGCYVPLAEVARPLASMGYDVVMPYWKMEATPALPDDVVDETARERTMIAVITRDDAYRDSVLSRFRQRGPGWHIDGDTLLGATGAKIWVLSRAASDRRAGG